MKPIFININDEYKIKIESVDEFEGSIFKDVYKNATKKICDIISQTNNVDEFDSYNNILAFTGERGKGKSSSMISFRNALIGININKNNNSIFFNKSEYKNIMLHNFIGIDIIDPSLFRGNESLFEIVVAKMFSNFQKLLKNEKNDISEETRRELIKIFQVVFDNLKIINSNKKNIYNLDSIEALSSLAYGSNLRNSFGILIEKYIEVFGDKKSFLVIAIDDFDLNISKSYEMLEDLRHFLIQKKIILLIACKIEQLKDSITNEIIKEYKYKLNLQQKNTVNNSTSIDETIGGFNRNKKNYSSEFIITSDNILNEISNKSEKYIEKLIPFNHQIFLPSLIDFCDIEKSKYSSKEEFKFYESKIKDTDINTRESVIYIGENDYLNGVVLENILDPKNELLRNKLIQENKLFVEKNIYDCLLKLIFLKSNIFINKTNFRYNSIFPSTLRELSELIKVFNNIDVLENFRRYILNKSIYELPENFKKIILEIDKQDFSIINSHIIGHLDNLKEYFESSNFTLINEKELSKQSPLYISIGDVVSKLKILYENVKPINIDWYKFLDLMSVYYSIRINQTLINRPDVILEYCKGGLFNGDYKVFPNTELILKDSRRRYQRRDWINYKIERKQGQSINAIFKSLDQDNAYWLAFFIQYFGIPDFRNSNSSPYFRNINQGGGGVLNLTFSPFAIFTNILFPQNVWDSIFSEDFDYENKIFVDIKEWQNHHVNFQNLLLNSMFFIEFTDNLSIVTSNAFKKGLPSYFETLHWYFSDGIKNTLDLMLDKYDYLNINSNVFDNHPIMRHWKKIIENNDSFEDIKNLFEIILIENTENSEEYQNTETKSQLDENVKKILNQILNILKTQPNITSRKITNRINLIPKEKEEVIEITRKLDSIKKGLNNKDKEKISKTKNEIIEYINNKLNG